MFGSMNSLLEKRAFKWSLAFLICLLMGMIVNSFQFAVIIFVESRGLLTETGAIIPSALLWVNVYITVLLLVFIFMALLIFYILFIIRDDNMSRTRVFFLKTFLVAVIMSAFYCIGFYFLFN